MIGGCGVFLKIAGLRQPFPPAPFPALPRGFRGDGRSAPAGGLCRSAPRCRRSRRPCPARPCRPCRRPRGGASVPAPGMPEAPAQPWPPALRPAGRQGPQTWGNALAGFRQARAAAAPGGNRPQAGWARRLPADLRHAGCPCGKRRGAPVSQPAQSIAAWRRWCRTSTASGRCS